MEKFYTQTNVNITENVNKGNTKVFTSFVDADTYAKEKHTYMFPVWILGDKKHSIKEKVFYGYGVPR